MMLKVAILMTVAFTLCEAYIRRLPRYTPVDCEHFVDDYIISDVLKHAHHTALQRHNCMTLSLPVPILKPQIKICFHNDVIQNLDDVHRHGNCRRATVHGQAGIMCTLLCSKSVIVRSSASISLNEAKPLNVTITSELFDVASDVFLAFEGDELVDVHLTMKNVRDVKVRFEGLFEPLNTIISFLAQKLGKIAIGILSNVFELTLTNKIRVDLRKERGREGLVDYYVVEEPYSYRKPCRFDC